ncbi:hypothetical protein GCM10010975_26450 [Comamonas phosphati]|nr:hypothetical protein GCM10010975_26450 [Comamonas phosphati]
MIERSTDIRAALRSRQRGFLLNPFRFGAPAPGAPSGYIVAAAAGSGDAAQQRSSTRTDLPTWAANFGGTISEGLFSSALTIGGDTGTSSKTIPGFTTAQVWRIECFNNYYINDDVSLRAEFLNASSGVVAAFEIARSANFSQRMSYGASLASMTAAGTSGSSPQVYGTLTFDASGMHFIPIGTGGNQVAWSQAGSFSTVTSVRFTNLRAKSSSPASGGFSYTTIFRNP